jgi:hypothetical protein
MPVIETDAGRDQLEVQVRLDKVVLLVHGHNGDSAQSELTPAEARKLAELLGQAALGAEQTPT